MFNQPNHLRPMAGFTLIELLLTLAVIGVLGTITLQTFHNWLPRLNLRSAVQQSKSLITKARLEAIQRGATTVVEADSTTGTLTAYADVNGNPSASHPDYARYLIYDPDVALGEKQTDYLIGRVALDSTTLGGGGFAAVDGFTTPPSGSADILVFSSTGVPDSLGAFRLADAAGRNVLEVAIVSLAGKVESRKYLNGDDAPTSSPGFFAAGADSAGQNVWTWY